MNGFKFPWLFTLGELRVSCRKLSSQNYAVSNICFTVTSQPLAWKGHKMCSISKTFYQMLKSKFTHYFQIIIVFGIGVLWMLSIFQCTLCLFTAATDKYHWALSASSVQRKDINQYVVSCILVDFGNWKRKSEMYYQI